MIWAPPPPICSALAASISLPFFVLLLSHGPWRIDGPMSRFVTASVCALSVMLAGLGAGGMGDWVELTAALILFFGSVIAGFTCWSLVAWGFTLSMLRVLDEQHSLGSMTAWCNAYTGGQDIEAFAADRCRLLIRVGLARPDTPGGIAATPFGRLAAPLVELTRRCFGLIDR
jgi:hypothetical protein